MKNLFIKTIILIVFLFIAKPVFGAVVINEVLYNATGLDTGKEYVILYNNGDSAIDLTNYELNAVSGDYYIFPSFSFNAKSSIVIHWRIDGTNSLNDLYTGTSGFDANMGDTSGWIALFKSSEHTKDTIIDYVEYGAGGKTFESKAVDAGIWTAGTFIPNVVEDKAIKLQVDGADNNLPSDWIETIPTIIQEEPASPSEESETEQETKSKSPIGFNPPIANAGNDIIGFVNQEIKFDGTNSSDMDNDELAYAWNMGDGKLMEKPSFTYKYMYPGTYLTTLTVFDGKYYSSDTITIKIQAAQITINEFMANPSGKDEEEEWIEVYNGSESIVDVSGWQLDDMDGGSKPFIFPANTLIAPKSYLVFPRQITSIALNNDTDSVRLLLPEGILFQEVNYENPELGKSSARTDEGFVWSEPSPGAPNINNIPVASDSTTKNFIYQQPILPETVKYSANSNIIDYQNSINQKIEGGYVDTTNNQTASIKPLSSGQNPLNLVLLIIAVVFGAGFIGLLLIKFRRKNSLPSTAGLPT